MRLSLSCHVMPGFGFSLFFVFCIFYLPYSRYYKYTQFWVVAFFFFSFGLLHSLYLHCSLISIPSLGIFFGISWRRKGSLIGERVACRNLGFLSFLNLTFGIMHHYLARFVL
ncbi:hypothetical protein DFH27DRAFT_170681 [Peziza echinospora]|nr:hypothetical protein DFH27DRAFT_170681 [Peziza echinospora]